MRTDDLVRLSLRSIVAYKLRSGLTALGIVVGISAVVLLTSIGEGIHHFVLAEFTQFGTNLIGVTPGKTTTFGISGATISNVRPLSLADAQALERLDSIKFVLPLVQGNAQVKFGRKGRRCSVFGVGSAVPEVWQIKVAVGKFLPSDDQRAARAFAVLGSKLHQELFGNTKALGQRIRVGSNRYRVVGIMESKGQMLGFDLDDSIYIPTGKALELFNRESLMEIDLLYENGVLAENVAAAVKRLLIARHGQEDFTIITQEQMLDTLGSILNVLTLAVGALGGISLLVGAVGVLTVMTIAVSERVSEIGLLRAVGAERRTILRLFLGEALILSAIGGVVGIILGITSVKILGFLVPALPVKLSWSYIFLAFMLSVFVGLVAGIVPAMRAAKLQPLEALRAE